jgi:hypothetical protein
MGIEPTSTTIAVRKVDDRTKPIELAFALPLHHAHGHGHRIVDRVVALVSLLDLATRRKQDQCPMQCRVLRAGK